MKSSLIAGLVFLVAGTVNGGAQEPSIVESRGIEFPAPLLEHPPLTLVDDGFGRTEQPGMSSSDGKYLLWGIGIGSVGGIVWGAVAMSSSDAYVGPPAFLVTVPAGILVGGAMGWVVEQLIGADDP